MNNKSARSLDWQAQISGEGDCGNEVRNIYDRWASSYDAELRDDAGYLVPGILVDVLTRLAPSDAEVLDAGAGTGLVGELLHKRGYTNLVAMDISAKMLEEANAKGVYRSLLQQTLGQSLDIPSSTFDAVIAVGVFGPTHAPARSFDELIRVTRSGGHIVFSMRIDECTPDNEFGRRLADTADWRCVACSNPFRGFSAHDIEFEFCAWAYCVS